MPVLCAAQILAHLAPIILCILSGFHQQQSMVPKSHSSLRFRKSPNTKDAARLAQRKKNTNKKRDEKLSQPRNSNLETLPRSNTTFHLFLYSPDMKTDSRIPSNDNRLANDPFQESDIEESKPSHQTQREAERPHGQGEVTTSKYVVDLISSETQGDQPPRHPSTPVPHSSPQDIKSPDPAEQRDVTPDSIQGDQKDPQRPTFACWLFVHGL